MQATLTRFYGLDEAPGVDAFVRAIDGDEREAVLVREGPDDLELIVQLPRSALEARGPRSLDQVCQIVEGVSHFVLLAERARRELPTTHLELELQAEVDKYVMLVAEGVFARARGPGLSAPRRAEALRSRLFERASFVHPRGTERGDRYRMANDLAARLVRALEATFLRRGHLEPMRAALGRFYRAGQTEKIALAQAA